MQARLKALALLQKLERRALDALAQDLSAAQTARAMSEARIRALDQRAATEASCTSPEAMPYIGRFMATLRREQARESAGCQQLTQKIDVLRDQVMAHFNAGRSWEMLSDRVKSDLRAEGERRSEFALEDMTSARHASRPSAGGAEL